MDNTDFSIYSNFDTSHTHAALCMCVKGVKSGQKSIKYDRPIALPFLSRPIINTGVLPGHQISWDLAGRGCGILCV